MWFAYRSNSLTLKQVFFNTSPQDTPTHWKQTVLYLPTVIASQPGDLLTGELVFARPVDNPRGLALKLTCSLTAIEGGTGPVLSASYTV